MPSAPPPPPSWRTPRPPWQGLALAGARAAVDLARLVVPVQCPGCGMQDVRWCEECEAVWWDQPLRSETAAPRLDIMGAPALPLWAIASLDGPAQGMVVAWKDGHRRDLDAFLAAAMRRAAASVASALAGRRWAVVPVPARAASTARRGVDLPALLARAACDGLADAGVTSFVAPVLTPTRTDQRGQGAAMRFRQAAGIGVNAASVRACAPADGGFGSTAALLVDDVVTTGASMAAAARALDVTFLTAAAALALASAPGSSAPCAGALV